MLSFSAVRRNPRRPETGMAHFLTGNKFDINPAGRRGTSIGPAYP